MGAAHYYTHLTATTGRRGLRHGSRVRARTTRCRTGHDGIVQTRSGECVLFRVGEDKDAVHSEPESHGDRIFVNVGPGHEAGLQSLMAKWGMEYPRAWRVGLPFQGMDDVHCRDVGQI